MIRPENLALRSVSHPRSFRDYFAVAVLWGGSYRRPITYKIWRIDWLGASAADFGRRHRVREYSQEVE